MVVILFNVGYLLDNIFNKFGDTIVIKKTSENCAVVTELQCVRKHPNADRLQLATVLGTTVVVGLDSKDNDVVVYFDSNLRLSHEFLHENNLYSSPELNKDTTQKGYFGKSGHVRAQKLRGELSNGFVAYPDNIYKLYKNGDLVTGLTVGMEFNSIDEHDICDKFVVGNTQGGSHGTYKKQTSASKMFHKHWDTKQLMREVYNIPQHATYYLEEKIHGTSGRTGLVIVSTDRPWWKFWQPKFTWKVVSGTRRVDNIDYHIPVIRKAIENKVAPHLKKGETLYYEIYGYNGGKEIQTGFPYDCRPGEFKAMLYRITITNEDGYSVDMSRQYIYNRAGELGLVKPHLFGRTSISMLEGDMKVLCRGQSNLHEGTLLEGVVVWFEDNHGNWTCLKHKSEEFLLLDDRNKEKGIGDTEDCV